MLRLRADAGGFGGPGNPLRKARPAEQVVVIFINALAPLAELKLQLHEPPQKRGSATRLGRRDFPREELSDVVPGDGADGPAIRLICPPSLANRDPRGGGSAVCRT